ncbi:hypothetical protein HHK36_012261 [Tetracentron sinense]|uniref:Ubiquitin-conjugating enzyme E2 32 n=1 Tax=Tetracentron sinense TaxID=13715 RepID=A0A835DHX9_TETSI|nr:hypothetical protein HHK36_012261 [Tetracentron sinense]
MDLKPLLIARDFFISRCIMISNLHLADVPLLLAVRTALVALIAFMPTNPDGALGSLDYKKEERHTLAIKSREAAPRFGNPERQKLIDEIHQYMLSKAPTVPQLSPPQPSSNHSANREDEAQVSPQNAGAVAAGEGHPNPERDDRIVQDMREVHVNANAGPLRVRFSAGLRVSRRMPAANPNEQPLQRLEPRVQKPANDRLFTWAAAGLTIAIACLLLNKFLKSSGHVTGYMDGL